MENNKGYCYAYRDAWTHPAFNNLREAAIWNFLYQNAFYEDGLRNFNNHTFELKRGQIVISPKFIADGFGMSEKGVRTTVLKLEKLGMLVTHGTSRGTIITICNYDKYQRPKKTKGELRETDGRAEGRAEEANNKKGSNINKKEKNIKKENEEFEKFWEDYGKIGSKEKARKAFEKIKVEPVELSKGLQRYRAYCAKNEWYQRQDASTWLENKGWEDDRPTRIQEKSDENQLTSEELRIARLGHAAWRRRMKLQLNVEQAKFLEAYEDKNGNVWWDNLRQYKEKKR